MPRSSTMLLALPAILASLAAPAPADEPRPGIGDTWTERGGARGGSVPQTVELPAPA